MKNFKPYYFIHLFVFFLLANVNYHFYLNEKTETNIIFPIVFTIILIVYAYFIFSTIIVPLFEKTLKFNLRYETWSKIMGGNGISGTIRTIPENYYVATVNKDKTLSFEGIEAMTKNINHKAVIKWFNENNNNK